MLRAHRVSPVPSCQPPNRRWALVVIVVGMLLGGCQSDGWPSTPPELPRLPALAARVTFSDAPAGTDGARFVDAVIRLTPEERAQGLMYRKKRLSDDEGMLFVMDGDEDHSFWMKNTFIPLDMMFIRADGTIAGILQNVPPLTRDSRRIGKPSRYVLELDGGYCQRHAIVPGQRVELKIHSP